MPNAHLGGVLKKLGIYREENRIDILEVTAKKPKINFEVRRLRESDFANGFFETLSNLSEVGQIGQDVKRATRILNEIDKSKMSNIFVAVDKDGKVLGSITLLLEQKYIHDGGKVGHIEDVVTRKEYAGRGIGLALVDKCINLAKEEKCYKIILDCSTANIPFYKKAGFREHETSMRYDFY
jgi:glucosamine-phosphate N-acetyltransferase